MESGGGFSAPQDTAKVRFANERPAANKQRTSEYTDKNCPRLKKSLVNSWYRYARRNCDEACLELGLYPVPKKQYSMFYRGFSRIQSNTRMPFL